jgi:hypothetical protein
VAILEYIRDEQGSVIVGWLQAGVIYARFSGVCSAELADGFARRFRSLVGDHAPVRYYADYSALESYDIAASVILFDVLLEKREQFQLITLRPWSAPLTAKVQAMLTTLGCVELTASAEAFDERLRAATPLTNLRAITVAPSEAMDTQDERSSTSAKATSTVAASNPSPKTPRTYTYVFEFGDFERGNFTATRHASPAALPKGTWVCVARGDEQALELAQRAALFEWARPQQRQPQDFTVRFVNAPVRPSLDRRR